ncbi:hypothetical protein [Pseudanabaena mucicola]|uniref:Uncharacterized protein n=1 Tax=Pseudanabaena mucicola FACHB-723 TaxID=2692860 RepID=A0ABR7ZVR2_9CYAN|nr:hypothetical protein [Pseudanabaena mucicola]MBD2187483.1 hypothetical protein [Pseudanabaena mucicola FACHB-723]
MMITCKFLGLFAIASGVFALNPASLNAQIAIGNAQSNQLSPAQQILQDMQQSNAPAVGGGSMQILRFTGAEVSLAPLEGLDRLFNWEIKEESGITSEKTLGDRVEEFKLNQRQRIVSDSEIFNAIDRLKREN